MESEFRYERINGCHYLPRIRQCLLICFCMRILGLVSSLIHQAPVRNPLSLMFCSFLMKLK